MKKLEALKTLYTALGGSSSTVAGADTTIEVLNAILKLGSVEGKDFVGDAVAAIAANLSEIDPSPAATLITKEITANGNYAASSDQADGYSSVSVSVSPVLQNKSVTPTTSDQTITADSGKDGLGTVTVSAVTAAIDPNITAENIKDGVTILGVMGEVTPRVIEAIGKRVDEAKENARLSLIPLAEIKQTKPNRKETAALVLSAAVLVI